MEKEPQIEEHSVNSEEPSEEYGPPIGARTFTFLMLLFYVVYWVLTWFEVFVNRG